MFDFTSPHRRYNPLADEWILVSPHRSKRPWQGTVEASQQQHLPEYEPTCHLCPGNIRTNDTPNPAYEKTFVFTNDHSALLPDSGTDTLTIGNDTIQAAGERGVCKVICYSPSHNKTIADMSRDDIQHIIATWADEYKTIGALDYISHVQIFENKGPLMGASSPHPHGQIWASEHIPTRVATEQAGQQKHMDTFRSPLLYDYLKTEQEEKKRIVYENEAFVVLVPFWATWPYETMVLPKARKQSLVDLTDQDRVHLADALKDITTRYDKLFKTPFPYSMGIHQAPTDKQTHPEWQLHIHFYPPLLRSATIKKYFVGYEMLAESQRDINPEDAAETLRNLNE